MDICRPGSKWTWKEFKNPTKKTACTGAAHYAQVDEPLISHLFPSLVMLTVFIFLPFERTNKNVVLKPV